MLARRHTLALSAAILSLAAFALACPAHAQAQAPPPPLADTTFGFPVPGDYVTPATATSAGLALADRWLGSSVYENPAARMARGIEVTPVVQRTSRQDLSSSNRDFEQTFAYFDLAGLALSLPAGQWGLVLYGWQPVLRLEEQTYTTGPQIAPAQVHQLDTQREVRAGGAISHGLGAMRVGVAAEWVHRDDKYESHTQSGLGQDDIVTDFKGDGYGVGGGVTFAKDTSRVLGYALGGAVHYSADIPLTGTVVQDLAVGDTTYAFTATRGKEWSGGVSAKMMVSPATWVVLGLSGRSGQAWDGFGVATTAGGGWSAGLDWKDDELPWGARFGVGQEWNPGALEKQSGLVSIGFTYVSNGLVMDVALFHRNLDREGFAHSADNRALLSVKVGF